MSTVWFLSHILTGRLPCYIVVPGYTVYLDKLKSRLLDTLFRAYRHGQTRQLPECFLFVGFGDSRICCTSSNPSISGIWMSDKTML